MDIPITLHLKKRSDIHWARKIWHITGVFALYLCFEYFSSSVFFIGLLALFSSFVIGDLVRLKSKPINDFFIHAFSPVLRESEVSKLAGTTYLLSGVVLVDLIFPHRIVALTLLFLAFADPIASFIGIKFGREKLLGNKTLQGFVAAFLVCMTITMVYLYIESFTLDRIIVIGLMSAVVGALSELVPLGSIDDNLSMPVLSATGLTLIFYFFDLLHANPTI